MNKKQQLIIGIACLAIGGLYVSSTTWFRFRLAGYYKEHHQYAKAAELCNKILRKNNAKEHKLTADKAIAAVNFDLGYLYSQLFLPDLAIESYSKGAAGSAGIGWDKYITGQDLEKDKLLALGLLEAGKFDEAAELFGELKRLYPGFTDAAKYLNTVISLKKKNLAQKGADIYFALGDTYIENRLFSDARAFFTKRILDYGVKPMDVLNYVYKSYSGNSQARQRVWGENLYVSLEDFECFDPQLRKWTSNMDSMTNSHRIAVGIAYKGSRSEFLDITYRKEGYDYWAKSVDIPLVDSDFDLGVRAAIKSAKPFKGSLRANIRYPQQKTNGICKFDYKVPEGVKTAWQIRRIDNFIERAKLIASGNNWDMRGMKIDKIIVNTQGVSGAIYVDEIQLYLIEHSRG